VPGAWGPNGAGLLPAGRPGQLTLTPVHVAAPIGSDVVLLSGLVGPSGYYSTGDQIEWAMAQGSVGQFFQVGGTGLSFLDQLFNRRPNLVSGGHAVSRSSRRSEVITRGTPNPLDDVWTQPGQSWVSVVSSVEGTSHVSVTAPGATGWDRVVQTATIHWIDAQWTLPPPAIVRGAAPHRLETVVTRSTNQSPLTGWIVRYEVVGGAAATFARGSTSIEAIADAEGRAAAQIVPQGEQGGTTQVRVQIVRPPQAADESPLVLGEGFTTVTWSAPGLAVRVSGPDSAASGDTVKYRVEVSNTGDVEATNVTLSHALPANLTLVSSNPSAQAFGDRVQWRLGNLAGRAVRVVEVECRAEAPGDARYCVTASSGEGLTAEQCTTTRITAAARVAAPALFIRMEGPTSVEQGGEAHFRVEITNRSDRPLSNVQMVDRFDAGLEHSEGQASPISQPLGELAAGETRRVGLTFKVTRQGRLCHTIEVSADDTEKASATACIAASAPRPVARPEMTLRFTTPTERRTDQLAELRAEVTNAGNVPLTGVTVAIEYDAAMRAHRATGGFAQEGRSLVWSIERLEPRQTQSFQLNCRCEAAKKEAVVRAVAQSAEGASDQKQAILEILAAEPDAESSTDGNEVEPSGRLEVTIAETADPLRVGDKTTYLIVVKNDRTVADRDVAITYVVPDGMKFERLIGGPVGVASVARDGRTFELRRVAEMRPGETLEPLRVEVTAERAGKFRFRVEVSSQRSPEPIPVEEETTVFVE